jgi:hypothetical protein
MNNQTQPKKDIYMAVAYTATLVVLAFPASFLGMRILNLALGGF